MSTGVPATAWSVTDSEMLINLASARLGARALLANDEFFGAKDNLLSDAEPVANDQYTDRGKWMDGWETRRRREPGHDWCVIRLGARGAVRRLVIDTAHFKGNHPPECSVDGLDDSEAAVPAVDAPWRALLDRSPLDPDEKNVFDVDAGAPATHLRLNIFPDGGIARIRALGEVVADLDRLRRETQFNLAAIENGALVVLASDMFFGDRQNLIMPARAASMRDGWETRRRRGPGHDWAIVRLAAAGTIHRVEVDTTWFKGNAPASCSLDLLHAPGAGGEQLAGNADWVPLLGESAVAPDANHVYDQSLLHAGPATHVRLNIFPDGGVSRFLVWGRVAA